LLHFIAEAENKSSSTTMEAETESPKPEEGEGSTKAKEEVPEEEEGEKVEFKVMFCKKKYDVSFGMDRTVGKLKEHLHEVIGKHNSVNICNILQNTSKAQYLLGLTHICKNRVYNNITL
jgi:hypothetical protein